MAVNEVRQKEQVSELEKELAQRDAELGILNSVQQGLASVWRSRQYMIL